MMLKNDQLQLVEPSLQTGESYLLVEMMIAHNDQQVSSKTIDTLILVALLNSRVVRCVMDYGTQFLCTGQTVQDLKYCL